MLDVTESRTFRVLGRTETSELVLMLAPSLEPSPDRPEVLLTAV